MIAGVDYVGLSAAISATFAGVVSILVAMRQAGVKQQVNEVHAAVSLSNGATLGMVAEKVSDQLDAQDAATEAKK